MLANLSILKTAYRAKEAIGGFNMTTLESALAIVEAAQKCNQPVILQISEKTIDYMGLKMAYTIAKESALKVSVPIVIHFDHGRNFDLVREAVKIGFTSAMLDVSQMPKEKRIPFVKDFVNWAHSQNVTVEAEEDSIGGKEDYVVGDNSHFTDPARAKIFVEQTGIDALAVSIGSFHGKPISGEKLDLELLRRIRNTVDLPLVLHGASSTAPNIIKQAISLGIAKINIDTDLRISFTETLRSTLLHHPEFYDPREILSASRRAMIDVVSDKISLFSQAIS